LDWIVMKALEKDRGRRYETASGFARDVERYLADEPVEACPPSAAYKIRKFARKNKKALAVAGAFAVLLAALGGGVGWMLNDRAARQREADTRVRDAESRVDEALATAEPLLREGDPANLALVSAAQRVQAQLDSGVIRPEVRWRAEQFLRDVRMLAELEENRLRHADSQSENGTQGFNDTRSQARYAEALAEYGIDVLTLDPAEAAARIHGSAIREALLQGLDDLIFSYLVPTNKPQPQRDRELAHLRQVAAAAVDSAWRRAFLEAAVGWDALKLKALAGQPEALAQPPRVLSWLGWSLIRNGSPYQAAAMLRQALQRQPKDFWLNFILGVHLCDGHAPEKHPGETVGYCRTAVALRPSSAEAYSVLGAALVKTGDTDDAIAAYEQALALDRKRPWTYNLLAHALARKGDLNGVIACCKHAVKVDPRNPRTHFQWGLALVSQGKHDEAIVCFKEAEAECRKAIRLKPDDPWLHNSLAWFLSTCPDLKSRDPGQALTHAQKAVELAPQAGGYWNTLGVAQYRNGDWKGAIEALMKSIQLGGGGDSSDYFFLAMAHGKLDEKEKARAWYDQGVAWMDKNDPRNELMKRFHNEAAALLGLAKAAESPRKNE
jgi:tetratricopeptide (TPR) repeat protein